ncbi:MAG: hypothetical protein RL077_5176 [Verrucomicrobiota bacterium]|jgi:hypothetical protein
MTRFFLWGCALGLVFGGSVRGQGVLAGPLKLAEVVVSPSRFGVADMPMTAAASLTAAQLEVLPQVGDDLFRSIARLPGLAADDVSAQFWVRGAPPSELLVRLDGVDLIEPFHLKDVDGALSIVDPATIRRLDLSTGGFTAEYGDRLGGVLTMETKSASAPISAVSLSLTGLGAASQGVFAGNRGRWLASARRGYPDVALKLADRDDQIMSRYYDVTAKVEYAVTASQTVSLHALHAGDTFRYDRLNSPSLVSGYDSDYVWGRWQGRVGEHLKGEAVVAWTRLTWNRQGSGRLEGFPFTLRDGRKLEQWSARQDWQWEWSDRLVFLGGLGAQRGESRYDYALTHQRTAVIAGTQVVATDRVNAVLAPSGDALHAYASAKFRPLPSLVLEPGVRFERTTPTGASRGDPRVHAALSLGRATLRAAWGQYSQAQGLHELNIADGERSFRDPERAEHRVLGVEYPVSQGVALRVEAYERLSTRLRPRWENLDNGYDLFPEAQPDRAMLTPQAGRARGLEILMSSRGAVTVPWHLSYVLSQAEERLGGRWIPRARDQRHAFYADATYVFNPRWQVSSAWHFHSGWPATDVVFTLAPLANGRRLLVSANGPAYGLRLPAYHRLDLRVTRRFKLPRGELRAYLDIFNAYDRTNSLGYEHRVTVVGTQVTDVKKVREQLPLLPSAGLTWEF